MNSSAKGNPPPEAPPADYPVTDIALDSEAFRSDPYPIYHALRRRHPVVWHSELNAFLVTRHRDVLDVLRAPEFLKDRRYEQLDEAIARGPLVTMKHRWVLYRNPPFHTHMRAIMSSALRPGATKALEGAVASMAERLMATHLEEPEFDVVSAMARPLPLWLISELLGVRTEDQGLMKELTTAVFRTFDPGVDADAFHAGERAAEEFSAYFRELFSHSTRETGALQRLRAACADERCSLDEAIAACVLLFVAGHETTTDFIGNAVIALAKSPEAQRYVRKEGLTPRVLDELWRFDASVQQTVRVSPVDMTVGEVSIPAGRQVMVLLGAANRDPAVFAGPDALDFERPRAALLSFGAGIHYCLGAPLARLEVMHCLRALFTATRNFELTGAPLKWHSSLSVRGVESLPLRLELAA